jgi:NADH-quinone oxidoreductase subunit C
MSREFERGLEDLEASATGPAQGPGDSAPTDWGAVPYPSVNALRARFGDAILRYALMAGDEPVVFVAPERNVEILTWLRDDPGERYALLLDVTAVDFGGGRPLQVIYQLWSLEHRRQLRVKAELPLSALEIDSATSVWKGADWLERETYDMFGIRFRGHPDLRRILMPDNYAEGHPLRKDFPLRGRFSRAEQTRRALAMAVEDHYTLDELRFMREAGQVPPDPTAAAGPPNPMPPGGGA